MQLSTFIVKSFQSLQKLTFYNSLLVTAELSGSKKIIRISDFISKPISATQGNLKSDIISNLDIFCPLSPLCPARKCILLTVSYCVTSFMNVPILVNYAKRTFYKEPESTKNARSHIQNNTEPILPKVLRESPHNLGTREKIILLKCKKSMYIMWRFP